MKKISALILGLGFCTQLSAATLLQSKTSGGYVSEEYRGGESGVKIDDSGWITGYFKKNYTAPVQYTYLGRLSGAIVSGLQNQVQSLPAGELVFPNDPECADAPDTEYSSPKYGKVFALNRNCRTGYLAGAWEARDLESLLKTMNSLRRLTSEN